MGFFAPREAKTTLKCPVCKHELDVVRQCRTAWVECPHCGKRWPIAEWIAKADKAMEEFLDNCYIDRI